MMRLSKPPDIVFNFKYALFPNLKVLSALLIFTVFSIPFTEAPLTDPKLFITWLGVGGVVTSIVIGLLFSMKILLEKRYGSKVPVNLILMGGAAIGALKGASTEYFVNVIAIHDSFPWDEMAVRAYSGSFLGVGLGFALSLKATYSHEIKSAFNQYQLGNQELAEEIASLGREVDVLKDVSKERLLKKIIENLKPLTTDDVLATDPEKNWRKISEALRIGIANRIRSESYELNYTGNKSLTIKEQVKKVFLLEKVNLHPRVLALVQFSTGASITYVDWNPTNSFVQLIINTFVSIMVTTYFRTLLNGRVNPSKSFNLAIISGVIFVNGSLYALVGLILWSRFDPFFQISLFFWHTFLVLTISTVSEIILFVSAQKELQESVNEDLLDKKRVLLEHLENQRHEISKHLHGFLITKIHSSTTMLDKYAEIGDFDNYKKELSALLSEFTFEGLQTSLRRDLLNPEYFYALHDSWDGLINLSIKMPDDLSHKIKKTQQVELVHVIEELISNAYRHGEAQMLTITIRWINEDALEIVARDNGKGAQMPISKGLGSKIFTSATDGNWSLRNIPGQGVQVQLVIEIYEADSEVEFTVEGREASAPPVGHTP